MFYLMIIIIAFIAIVYKYYYNKLHQKECLSRSRTSNLIRTVISNDGKYALIMYNHDPKDESQLGWALANAGGLENIDGHNLYFYNLGSKILSKRLLNDTFQRLKSDEYHIIIDYPNDYEIRYLFLIPEKEIAFKTIIKQ